MKSVAFALLTIGLATLTLPAFSQENLHPAIRDFEPYIGYWPDSTGTKDTTYWPNGRIRAIYVPKNDSIKTRQEFYESGNMRSVAELYQKKVVDTLATTNIITLEDTFVLFPYYIDILHGKYIEIFDSNLPDTVIIGTYKEGVPIGLWTANVYDGIYLEQLIKTKIEVLYNSEGYIEGQYREYNVLNGLECLKVSGQYKSTFIEKMAYTTELCKDHGYTTLSFNHPNSIPFGKWEFFEITGELKRTITYEYPDE